MKMKKTLLSSAIVAGLGSPMLASAINTSTDGVGEALLYPYYSAMNGNVTFITVTNTTNEAKAVKVRFREGVGSRDVMDFTVYLSHHDHWSAIVYREGNAVRISTNDSSCTVPDVAAAKPAFSATRIPNEYEGDSVPNRLSEGHIEILEMAELPNTGNDDVRDAITHDPDNDVPVDCDLVRNWTAAVALQPFGDGSSIAVTETSLSDGAAVNPIIQDMANPTGGLYGHAAVYNPADGTYFTYQATALRGWAEAPLWFPQNDTGLTELTPYTTDDGLAFDEGDEEGLGLVEYFDLPDLSTPAALVGDGVQTYTGSQFVNGTAVGTVSEAFTGDISAPAEDVLGSAAAAAKRDATTFALMRAGLSNDYITGTDFETEWVVTFPTRYLHVDPDVDPDVVAALPPFTADEDLVTGEACETVGFNYWNREEHEPSTPGSIDFSPGGTERSAFQLCYEVNVMAFNQSDTGDSAVLKSSSVAKYVGLDSGFNSANGWGRLDFSAYTLGTASGLPLAGFAAISNTGDTVPRGATFSHHLMDAVVVAP